MEVTYWTGIWDPGREAISRQVEILRRNLAPGAPVVSFSVGQRTRLLAANRVLRLSGRRWPLLRLAAAFLERRGELAHVIGGLDSWHLLRALGRRPLLLTVTLPGAPTDRSLLDKVAFFVAESEAGRAELAAAGIPAARQRLIYPGIDLERFRPAPPPSGRFRLLFASSPADPAEIERRGIGLLVEVARRSPEIDLVLLWRRWGDLAAARRALSELDPPANVRVVERDVEEMSREYAQVHAIACPYAPGFGKSVPSSVVEGLAVGRPALLSDSVGIAPLVEEHGAGRVARRDVPALAAALERLRADYADHAERARLLAERVFDQRRYLAAYSELYRQLRMAPE